ncbi:MAG: PQQ-like beta-propeller repeat protein [Gemmataceae bacterium]|nr:PQQ-like beta-propeller repeat protein [Gemmataceae bacterium]
MSARRVVNVLWVSAVWASTAAAGDPQWPQWRGPNRDNVWPVSIHPERLPEKLRTIWRKPIGGGYGGIAISGDRVFVMDRQTEPREVERVVALELATGQTIWTHEYPVRYGGLDYGNGPRATPTVHEGRVYTLGAVGHLHCLDAATGRVVWSHDCVSEYQATIPTWGLASSPMIDESRVVVQVGGHNGCWMAFDKRSGEVVWKALPDRAGYASAVRIAVEGRPQLIAWTAEHVTALEPETGKLLWAVPFSITYDVAIADPVYHDGVLLCGQYWEGSLALRLNADGPPEKLWEGKRLRLLMATPLVRDGCAYALDRENGLICVELRSGKVRWSGFKLSYDKRNPHAASWWSADGMASFLNERGEWIVVRLSPERVEELGRTKVFDGSWAHPGLTKDRIVVRDDREISCLTWVPPP